MYHLFCCWLYHNIFSPHIIWSYNIPYRSAAAPRLAANHSHPSSQYGRWLFSHFPSWLYSNLCACKISSNSIKDCLWTLKSLLFSQKFDKLNIEYQLHHKISFISQSHGWDDWLLADIVSRLIGQFMVYPRPTLSPNVQKWFSVELAFAKFLSKIKEIF